MRGSRFRRIFRGVYVDSAAPPHPRQRVEAALVPFGGTEGGAVASHASAARVVGVPLPVCPDEHVTVSRPAQRRVRAGIRCHVDAGMRSVRHDGVPISEYHRMFVELAELLMLVDLVVVGDNLVRRGLVTEESLRAAASTSRLPGARRAAEAAAYVRARVDSPMESRLRMLLVLAGLPDPEVNRLIRSADGEPLRRYDLSWPAVRVVVEYDGRHHIDRVEQWEDDLDRREAIDDDGWRILVVTARGIYREPGRTVLRVWRVLHRRGQIGVPPRPGEDWRPHFPGRT